MQWSSGGPSQRLLTSMETFRLTSIDSGSGPWFITAGIHGFSPSCFSPEMVKKCTRHLLFNSSGCSNAFLTLTKGECNRNNVYADTMKLKISVLSWFSFSVFGMKNAKFFVAAGTAAPCDVQPCPLLSPSSARVRFSTWFWITSCKIYSQASPKGIFYLLSVHKPP